MLPGTAHANTCIHICHDRVRRSRAYQGPHFGTSQTAKAAATSKHEVVWNFPIDIAFKSTNAFGWPRLVLSVRVELVWFTWHTRANDKSDEVLMVYFSGALH